MAEGLSRRERCRLCDEKDLELVVPFPPTAIADAYVTREELAREQVRYPLDLHLCHRCGHLQLLDVVDPRIMFRDDYTYQSGGSGGIVRHFQEYAASVLAREQPAEGALAVDVGSNDGTLLRFFQQGGMRVLGIDPAAELARAATAAGIETLPRFLDLEVARKVRADRGPARIVTANNVFAHADDLAGMAESIRALLAPDGLFVFEVSYLKDVVDDMLLGTIFHEHLCYHAVKPLVAFLARHGLELVDVERVTIQGGSIIGFAQHRGGPRPVSPRIGEMIRNEEENGLHQAETFRRFHGRITALASDISRLAEEIAGRGETVAGYGAARGGTTLLYALGIGEHLRFIVDDSPAKQGLFSPGHHIPILPPEAVYEQRPDHLFILAWVHARAIVRKHQRHLTLGGRFIVAHPRLEVVTAASAEQWR